MTASTDGETLRRSKRTKTTRKRPSTLGKQFDDDDDTAVTDELRLMVNQLQRDELEKLVMRLVSQSVDCAEIIEMETAQGRLQKAVTSFQVGGMAGYSQLGALGKLPAECECSLLESALVGSGCLMAMGVVGRPAGIGNGGLADDLWLFI